MEGRVRCRSSEVYVGNLPTSINEEELKEHISFENCELLRLIKKDIKAFCFIDCGSYENAVKFSEVMNGRDLMGRRMIVKLNDRTDDQGKKDFNKVTSTQGKSQFSPPVANTMIPNSYKNNSHFCSQPVDDRPPPLRPITDYDSSSLRPVTDYSSSPLRPVTDYGSSPLRPITDYASQPLKPVTPRKPVRNDSKIDSVLPHHCTPQYSPSVNSKYQRGLQHNHYFPSTTADAYTANHRFADEHCCYKKHGNDFKSNDHHSDNILYEPRSYQTAVKADQSHFQHFDKPRVTTKQPHNVIHYSQYDRVGVSGNQAFANNYESFDRQPQYRAKANYSSKHDLISRIQDLRLQQTSAHKPVRNYTSHAYAGKGTYSSQNPAISKEIYEVHDSQEQEGEEPEPIILSVVNFPYRTTEEMIFKLFEDYDPIEITMVCNFPADVPTEALVVLADEDLALNAIMELDNTRYRNRTIFVSDANDDNVLEEITQKVN